MKRVDDDVIIDSYNRLGNVWKVADEVGLCGQSVYERLVRLGKINRKNVWTEEDSDILKNEYKKYRSEFRLDELAERFGRTKNFICRKAKELGLTDIHHKTPDWARKELSINKKRYFENHEHPRGFLGHTQSEKCKKKSSETMKELWANKSSRLNSEEYRQLLSDRMSKMQGQGIMSNNYSRVHSGTCTIGGKTYFFRSSWEPNIAAYYQFLKERNDIKDWEYEADVFWFEKIKRGVRSYKPDFKITCNDESVYYVEVKGWMDDKSKLKLKRMRIYYPKVKLEVIDELRYRAIAKMSSVIPEWGAFEKGLVVKKETCKVDGCENVVFKECFCRRHYKKIRTTKNKLL